MYEMVEGKLYMQFPLFFDGAGMRGKAIKGLKLLV